MLIVMELQKSPKGIWLIWKKKLVGVWKVCILEVQFPFIDSPNATDSDLGCRPLASLPLPEDPLPRALDLRIYDSDSTFDTVIPRMTSLEVERWPPKRPR